MKEPKWLDSMTGIKEQEWIKDNDYALLWNKVLLEKQEQQRQEDMKRREELTRLQRIEERKKKNNEQFIRFCKENFPNSIFAFMMETGIEL